MSTLCSYNALNIFGKMKPFCFYGNKNKDTTPKSLSRIIDLAENDPLSNKNEDEHIKIAILPPTNATGDIADEDSADEDRSGTINNLPGSVHGHSICLNVESPRKTVS